MRKIIFRAKRKDTGEWVEGFYVCLGDTFHYILSGKLDLTRSYVMFKKYEIDPKTLGQYTGESDKNGNKIFEKDIVKVKLMCSNGEHTTEITTVDYDENDCCYSPMDWKESCQWCDYSTSIEEIEIIGNAIDNPDLLTA